MRVTTTLLPLALAACASAQSPVACYPFIAGATNDATGNGHDGTAVGPTIAADRFGVGNNAYWFDGTGDRVELPALGDFLTGDEFTVSFWLKTDMTAPQAVILTQPDVVTDRLSIAPHYNHNGANTVFWDFGNIFSGGRSSIIPFALDTTLWQHWVFTHSAADNTMAIFLDGALILTEAHSSTIVDRTRPVWIGGGTPSGGGSFHFHGAIDDVMFFEVALTNLQVAALYGDQVLAAPCSNISVPEVDASPSWSVTAEPGGSVFTIMRSGAVPSCAIAVTNLLGTEVMRTTLGEGGTTARLDLSGLASGTYLFVVMDKYGASARRVVLTR